MRKILWDKEAQKIRTEKDLRLFVRRFLKERLKGLPPEFRLEVDVLSARPRKVVIKIPAHSEGNPIRILQVDQLLEEMGHYDIQAEVRYLDDLLEENAFSLG